MIYGHCYDALPDPLRPAPTEAFRLLAEMGISVIRWSVYTNAVIIEPGRYDWRRTDADMEAMKKAKLQVLANPMWLPQHVTGGLPINEPYASSTWIDPHDGSKGRRYWTPAEKAFFFHPHYPPIDSAQIVDYGAAFAERYGPDIAYVSIWNEPGGLDFWPQKDAPPSFFEAMRPLYRDVYEPFMRGYRSKWKGSLILGSDSESAGNLDLFLGLESDSTSTRPQWPRYDIIGFHAYPEPGPAVQRTLERVGAAGGYLEVAAKYPKRPLWITEFAANPADPTVEMIEAIQRAFPQIGGVFPYLMSQWFNDGSTAAWDAGLRIPNAKFHAMQALVDATHTRRRAVHH